MRFSYTFFLCFCVCVFAISSCQKETNFSSPGTGGLTIDSEFVFPETVFSDYIVEYDGTTNNTRVTATFIYENPFDSLDGARVRLNTWSDVYCNGVRLTETRSTSYSHVFKGFIEDLEFEWQSWGFLTYFNEVHLNKANVLGTVYDLSEINNEFRWDGPPVENGEEVNLVFKKVSPAFWTSTPLDSTVFVPTDKLNRLMEKRKKGLMFFQRTKIENAQQATFQGGQIRTSYKSDCIPVSIVE
ncbi:MAG: hypothetical protein MK212_00415 [Saprospiraceae bacterium]|nr:hypothetical protein [Saprospiraceae bacterium]